MNIYATEVVKAAITATISAAVPIIIGQYIKRRAFSKVSDERFAAICGKWRGSIRQTFYSPESYEEFDVDMELKRRGRKFLDGQISISDTNHQIKLDLSGGFIDDHFVRFNYRDDDRSVIRYGYVLCKLGSDPRTIEANFLGYSALRNGITTGQARLNKAG